MSALGGKADTPAFTIEGLLMTQSRPDHVKPRQCRYLSGMTSSCCVVSTTNMASRRVGFVELGVGAHFMMVAGHLRPAFSCLVDMLGLVIDLTTDLPFQHGCIDEGRGRVMM